MKRITLALACLGPACLHFPAAAESYHNTDLQVFYTNRSKDDPVNGTGTSDRRLTSFRFEHYGVFDYGDNYFFADNYHGRNVGERGVSDQQYMAYMPRVSLGKVLGRDLAFGIVKDIYLGARLEYASYGSFRATGWGPSVDLDLPGVDWSQLRLFVQDTNYDRHGFYLHFCWGRSFSLGPRKAHLDGYLWTRKKDDGSRQWFAEPDLTVDVDEKGRLQMGLRVTYAKYGGYARTTPQLITKWIF